MMTLTIQNRHKFDLIKRDKILLANTKSLTINNCKLTEKDLSFLVYCQKLVDLDLSKNEIKFFDYDDLPNLTELNLSYNPLVKFKKIPKNLIILSLSNTNITKLPNLSTSLIQCLTVSQTKLIKLENLPINLVLISAVGCKFKNIDSLLNLGKLGSLFLSKEYSPNDFEYKNILKSDEFYAHIKNQILDYCSNNENILKDFWLFSEFLKQKRNFRVKYNDMSVYVNFNDEKFIINKTKYEYESFCNILQNLF